MFRVKQIGLDTGVFSLPFLGHSQIVLFFKCIIVLQLSNIHTHTHLHCVVQYDDQRDWSRHLVNTVFSEYYLILNIGKYFSSCVCVYYFGSGFSGRIIILNRWLHCNHCRYLENHTLNTTSRWIAHCVFCCFFFAVFFC